ncbi:MAG: EAL domain-containing response regulator [Sedimenticola sp.]|nr:EAL domain-containing response regulator [Sedimenticola sp.]
MNILLVDDDTFMLKIIHRQLANLGFHKITAVDNSSTALALLEDAGNSFEILLLDLQMPGIDGVEFIRHLDRLEYPGGVVLISGQDERILLTAEKLANSHNLRVFGALHKPVTPEQLDKVLRYVPDSAKFQSRKVYGPEALREGLARRELVNFYQPQIDIRSGQFTSVETLVRWQHPEDGLVFPDQFIGTAEDHGLIDELTNQVLSNALEQAKACEKKGWKIRFSVNISMDNLVSLDFADRVINSVESVNIPLSDIVLEVTESRLIKDRLAPMDILTRIRLKHIGLSIDDFGTGHSSLAQLRDIPFDELKIDRSFIHGAHNHSALRAIVVASLGMAQQLGIRTVAEGIEDIDDLMFLQATSCDLGQGYFIARPMPAEDLEQWRKDWQTRRREIFRQ